MRLKLFVPFLLPAIVPAEASANATGIAQLQPQCGFYQYRAIITDVYDGDTVTADIDLGFDIWRRNERLRLYGIDAPEVRGQERAMGLTARDALRQRLKGKEVTICTIKDKTGKYGRYLVRIFDKGALINLWLVRVGHAEPYQP